MTKIKVHAGSLIVFRQQVVQLVLSVSESWSAYNLDGPLINCFLITDGKIYQCALPEKIYALKDLAALKPHTPPWLMITY